jgi:hypothetical protein
MIRDEGDFLLPPGELSALQKIFSVEQNSLSLLPTEEPSMDDMKVAAAAVKQLTPAEQAAMKRAVQALAAPVRTARFHHAVADESITRSVLAWPTENSPELVGVVRVGNNRRVALRSPGELSASQSRLLAANDGLRDQNFAIKISSLAAITLLAVFDQLQHARMYSMLAHASPVDSVAPAEIFERLAEVEIEDFRWVLPFMEKVMPSGALTAITKEEIQSALVELANGGLLEAVDENATLYQLTGNGAFAADAVFHNLSRAAICTCQIRPDGVVGYETLLFLRGPSALFLYALGGQEGAVVTLTAQELESTLQEVFGAEAKKPPAAGGGATVARPSPTVMKKGNIPPPPEKMR